MSKSLKTPGTPRSDLAFSDEAEDAPVRLLIVADRYGATQEISFVAPLTPWRRIAAAAIRVIDEPGLEAIRKRGGEAEVLAALRAQLADFRPVAVVISRYNGRDYESVFTAAQNAGVPVVFHLDDDLFEVPIALGIDIFRRYRHPHRVHAMYRIAEMADVVYVSTPALGHRVRARLNPKRLVVSDVYVGADAALAGLERGRGKADGEIQIGYMASIGHSFDLELIAPALRMVLNTRPDVMLHFFGTICQSDVVKEFGDRVERTERVRGSYADFRSILGGLGWDIGLAPLRDHDFNRCKAPTKWLEYAEAGMAVLASDMSVYAQLAAQGALLACGDDEWAQAIIRLADDASLRGRLVGTSRQVIAREYSWRRVEDQVIDLLASLHPPARTPKMEFTS
ncbi:MAG TPA: hypothetical protein VIJ94_12760 [Caulobacteraceae bacterium]